MSTKDFKQGMVAGVKPFGDKLDQLAKASESGVSDIKEGLNGINEVVNVVLDDLSVQEKKRVYGLDTPQAISELEEDEKDYLLSVLFTIADQKESINDNQKFYLRTLKQYLKAVNVQIGIDLSTIENIESLTFQKIIMQTVMEFLYLEYESHDYMDDYEDYFDLFSINRKGVRELHSTIDHMVSLLGIEGLACHYSSLAEPEIVEENIFEEDTIPQKEEAAESETSNFLDGSSFENITIEGDISGKIFAGIEAYKQINGNTSYKRKRIVINGRVQLTGKWEFKDCIINAENGSIYLPDDISFNNCDIYVGPEFLKAHCNANIYNCRFIGIKNLNTLPQTIFLSEGVVENTQFNNILGQIIINRIYNCKFENCPSIEGYDGTENKSEIKNSIFFDCETISVESSLFESCKIYNSKSIFIGEKTVINCTFENCTVTDYEEALISDTMDAGASVSNCVFNNITMTEDSYLMLVFDSCNISNCIYNNCTSERRDRNLIGYAE